MAFYTYTELYGSGSIGETFDSGVERIFTFTNPSGSSYFTMETIPSPSGFYEASSPKNFIGTYVVSESMGLITSSYIASIVVQPGTQSFTFEPDVSVTGSTYYLRGTGGYSLVISAASAPVNTVAPALSYGLRIEGEPVNTSDGSWNNNPTSFTYQWYRDATLISGETLSQYILSAADVDAYISCEVTAINAAGSSTPEPSDSAYIFDTDYANVYYTYGDTKENESILQNQFMLAIKAAGVWAKLDALFVFRGSGESTALVNWVTLVEATNIDCGFDDTQGFIGDATKNAYINTNHPTNTGPNYTRDNASRYFFPYAFSGTGPMDGSVQGAGGSRVKMLLNNSTDHKINQLGSTLLSSAFQYTTTVQPKSIHRTNATDVTLFNGTTSASRTAASFALPTINLLILRDTVTYADHTVAAYAAGASMVAENADFVTAFDNYSSSL